MVHIRHFHFIGNRESNLAWFLTECLTPAMYGILLFFITWSIVRENQKSTHHKAEFFRSISFILGVTVPCAKFSVELTRIIVIASALLYIIVTLLSPD